LQGGESSLSPHPFLFLHFHLEKIENRVEYLCRQLLQITPTLHKLLAPIIELKSNGGCFLYEDKIKLINQLIKLNQLGANLMRKDGSAINVHGEYLGRINIKGRNGRNCHAQHAN
jgi:hypothetical protein